MRKFGKLLWMMFILGIVFFIIHDEKWIEISRKDNRIVFNKKEKSDHISDENLSNVEFIDSIVLHKNSDLIRIHPLFSNSLSLRESAGLNQEYLARLDSEKKNQSKLNAGNKTISLNSNNSVSSMLSANKSWSGIVEINEWDIITWLTTWWNISTWVEVPTNLNEQSWIIAKNLDPITKYSLSSHSFSLNNPSTFPIERYELNRHFVNLKYWMKIQELKSPISKHSIEIHKPKLKKGVEAEIPTFPIERYELTRHSVNNLKRWVAIQSEFVIEEENTWNNQPENVLSDLIMEDLLKSEEIDIKTLKNENDEFLQRVFQETRDINVMNWIVEIYLNKYQFVKAKRFIENLPDMYRDQLKPSLNLRVAFNSFALSSNTTNETLTAIIQNYQSKNLISTEDKNRYLWVLALMQKDYDRFFEIALNFTSEKNKSFTNKLQWYKDQISKQIWMPDYYFDTLVSLELFNQWLFQPAKILSLSVLQQNISYILPYQILAYANFLTNSRDTSIEYLKKLMDIDPNNAEKYRFLMWIAYYRNENYEQSVVMLSLIKDSKLRLDSERYLISNYLLLNQKNKLISSRRKLLWYENLVASDFYTYFYEAFYRPYSEWTQYQIYAFDTDLAENMLRVCNLKLSADEQVFCTYGEIGKRIALWQFDGLEQSLLNLATEHPQRYLYRALGEYYIQQWDTEKAKIYLIKAVSMTQKKWDISQIKKLLQKVM